MDMTPEQIEAVVGGILQIIGAFAFGAAVLPIPKSPAAIVARKVIDVLACNFRNAKNKNDE